MTWQRLFSNPVRLYHGTAASFATAALKRGFRPLKSKHLHVTDSLSVASAYAAHQAAVREEAHGVVLSLNIDRRILSPDEFAYLFLCANEQDLWLTTQAQLRRQRGCLQPTTGEASLREVGSAICKHPVSSSRIEFVKRVEASKKGSAPQVRDSRSRVRSVHRFQP